MTGSWATAMAAPFAVGTMLLLTDGSVLAQDSGTPRWWRLHPDKAGGYAAGTWRQAAAAHTAPLYFASAVLRDGRVFIAGGEFSNNGKTPVDLCTAEIYDPPCDRWTGIAPPPGWTQIGDAPCCVLPDGTILLGSIGTAACAIYDPVAGTWSATGAKPNPSSSEESWTLLPDGSVLTAVCDGQPETARFVDGAWIANGPTPVALVEAASLEIGPALLLPDGRVFSTGATGQTALFTPTADRSRPGTWTAGAAFPMLAGRQLGAKDAPACLLPNGRVLCAAGPVDGRADSYAGPATLLEYDPVANAWSAPLPAPPGDAGVPPYQTRMLLLPTGEVLVSNSTPTLQTYRPDGAPQPEWRPTVTACPAGCAAGTTQRLTGTQFNGLSQACAYGDDAAMATNYPLVRLRAASPDTRVTYCRTAAHSSMAVATGTAPQTTDFSIPADIAPGNYELEVVANGIASAARAILITAGSGRVASAPAADLAEAARQEQEELFRRDLYDVRQLMDFVSGRAGKSLDSLFGLPTRGADGKPIPTPWEVALKQVCEIHFPPEGGPTANPGQAALLLTLKDQLNEIADPARGLTIAYTSMFAGVASSGVDSWWTWWFGGRTRNYQGPSAARAAYPALESHARRFQQVYRGIPIFAFFVILLLVYINWDISITSSVLKEIAKADDDRAALFAPDRTFLPYREPCAEAGLKPEEKLACQREHWLQSKRVHGREDLQALFGARSYLRPIGLTVTIFGADLRAPATHPRTDADCTGVAKPGECMAPDTFKNFVIAVLSAFTGVVIPALFGLLGTLAGVVRSVARKVRDSVLAPRDYTVSVSAVFLGLVAGTAVGLFFNDSEAAGAAGKSFGITLSAAGLSFVAGYAADSFFKAMDALKTKLFSDDGAPAAAPPRPPAP